MGWKKKSAIIAGILAALYTVAGFLVIPLVAESILPERISRHTNRPAAVKNVSLNPYTLALSVEGVEIREKEGKPEEGKPFVSFDRFFVNLQWSSLFHRALVCRAVELENPLVRIARVSETEFNFSDLIPPARKKEAPRPETEKKTEEDAASFRFFLSNVKLSGGRVVFRDLPMDQTHRFSDIHFTLPVLSNFESDINAYAKPDLAGDFNKTRLQVAASTMPFADSLKTGIDISLSGIDLPRYFAYVPVPLGFSVEKGDLDLQSTVSFSREPAGGTRLEVSGTAEFSDLLLAGPMGGEILSAPAIRIQMAPSRPLQKKIRIEALTVTEPSLTLLRSSTGKLNLAGLGPPSTDASGQDNSSQAHGKEEPEEAGAGAPEQKPASGAEPFVFELGHFLLDAGKVRFLDYAAPSAAKGPQAGPVAVQLKAVRLEISDFSNQAGEKAPLDLSARLEPEARLSVAGNFGVTPPAADLDLEWSGLDLSRVQSYFPDALNLVLSAGRLDISGKASIRKDPAQGLTAGFQGRTGIFGFLLLEKESGRELTRWQSLEASGMDISWNPSHVKMEKLSLAGLRQNVVVEKNGALNFSRLYEKDAEREKEPEPGRRKNRPSDPDEASGDASAPPFPVSVGVVRLSDIALSFADHHVEPDYASRLTLAEGSIKGLSTEAFKGAKVSMSGALNQHAPVTIEGRINPLLQDLLLDVRFDLENLALPPFSAYSGKYIGRAIEKGKLDLNLDYRIQNRELDAQNKLLLDQFTLGRPVESDDAMNLPVGLAVALLKNRKGVIDLDLPVSGRLDDPQFSLAGIILQSLKNIITKAATSPFSLVSSIVPGGEELRYIEFKPGQTEITDAAREKMNSIQKLLYERPNLNLELTGYVDEEKDREALLAMLLSEKIRSAAWEEKRKKNGKGGEKEAAGVETIKLTDKEYEKYLRRVYSAEVLSGPDKPEDAKPLTDESLTAGEMKEKIRQQLKIPDERLRRLAQNRMQGAKNFILQGDTVSPKRLFLRQADSLSPPKPGEFKESRVELDLR